MDVNTDRIGTGVVEARFEPPPTGRPDVSLVDHDIFFNFGDGRFDPRDLVAALQSGEYLPDDVFARL